MRWWWPFRRQALEPLKGETRRNDHEIMALDRALAVERVRARTAHLRLHKVVVRVGDQFANVGRAVADRAVGER